MESSELGNLTKEELERALAQAKARSLPSPGQTMRDAHAGFKPVKLTPVSVRTSEPKYPPAAKMDARAWMAGHSNRTIGTVHVEVCLPADCTSCGGEGIVYLRFLADGPKRYQVGGQKPSTWLASTPGTREGWWVIEDRKGYPCPQCSGSGYEPSPAKE